MRRVTRWSALLSAGLVLAITTSAAHSQDKKPDDKEFNRQAMNRAIHANLKEVIDRGALLFNNDGDWNGCYHLYEGALMSVRPLLSDRPIQSWVKEDREGLVEALASLKSSLGERPQLKNVIETAITNARQTPEVRRRAFVVRVALDQIRAETKPAGAVQPKDSKPNDTAKAGKTLWDRLGGEAGVTKIVDDFANAVVADPKVDFFRHGKFKPEADEITKMKREIVEQVSQATGGPLKYTGPDMKKIHKGMGITGQQFDAAVGHLKNALQKNTVAEKDAATVLSAVKATRGEIVAPKKPADKKPEENKPADKKPGTKTSISGKVTYQGKPLPGGTILFEGKDGVVTAPISKDGSYTLAGVLKPGEYKVAVDSKALPAKYRDVKTSALTYLVQEGKQTFEIDLK